MAKQKEYVIEENSPWLLQEPTPDFDKAAIDQLRAALKRTHKERFLIMTSLMKDNLMMKKAKITYKPFHK